MSESNRNISFNLAKIKVEPKQDEEDDHPEFQIKREQERCPICLIEPPVNAIRLKCNHVFCFLCAKGFITTTERCSICRAEVDIDLKFGNVVVFGQVKFPCGSVDHHFWFYEGKNGWWLYDADTNRELEESYQSDKKIVEKLIAGLVYVISLTDLKQYQKSNRIRSRKICRDTLDLGNILGLAGLRNRNLLESMKRHYNIA